MQTITVVGVDIAKSVFQVTRLVRMARWPSADGCVVARSRGSSKGCLRAWSGWRRARRPITGPGRSQPSGTRCG